MKRQTNFILFLFVFASISGLTFAGENATNDGAHGGTGIGDLRGIDNVGRRSMNDPTEDFFLGAMFGGGLHGPPTEPQTRTSERRAFGVEGHTDHYEVTENTDGTETRRNTRLDENGNVLFWTETTFDSNDQAISGRTLNSDGLTGVREYQYEEGGRVREIYTLSDGRSVTDVEVNGRITKAIHKNKDGNIWHISNYGYTSSGRRTFEEHIDYEKGETTYIQYDTEGNQTETITPNNLSVP